MSINKLRSFAQRSSVFGVALAVFAAVVLPATAAYADSLNPLTERSLLLSSSAPGYQNTDGSGNSTDNLNANGQTFAPAGSGPNGQKSGETFTFKVSSDSSTTRDIKALTFQYCTSAAGLCQAPGDNSGDARTPDRKTNAAAFTDGDNTSDLEVVYGANGSGAVAGTDYKIYVDDTEIVDYSGWGMVTKNVEDTAYNDPDGNDSLTGKHNFVTLSTAGTGLEPEAGGKIQIVFEASETKYITNPGSGSFFVKINTYDSATVGDHISGGSHNIDGGVTVANVMTDSIHITTKVLETMSFSVGTRNRDTVVVRCNAGSTTVPAGCISENARHGTCDPIQQINSNRLDLGDPNAEFSLRTDRAYDVNSYWRLSSNSSGGASVYYSGYTLSNTVGDEIAEIGDDAESSTPGTEQFGLAVADAGADALAADFNDQMAAEPLRFKVPTLVLVDNPGATPDVLLQPLPDYDGGVGTIVDNGTATFAFNKLSNETPELIANNNDTVISCATAKMRYIANIGADTPAGVYTTKINYLAAPQY